MTFTPDEDHDGFVDSPYAFSVGQDDLPWTAKDGWDVCQKPLLVLYSPSPFWESYAGYVDKRLTVEWVLGNSGLKDAHDVRITRSENTNGVLIETPLPIEFGEIAAGSNATTFVRYHIPNGVSNWRTSMAAIASDACGIPYSYP